MDATPTRAPFAAMDHVATLARGKRFVELGSRNGDLIDCVSRFTASAVSIEADPDYCRHLSRRAIHSHGRFTSLCFAFPDGRTPDADIFYAWINHYLTLPFLKGLRGLQDRGVVRAEAQFALFFSGKSWPKEWHCAASLKPFADSVTRIPFDEGPGAREHCLPDTSDCPTVAVFIPSRMDFAAVEAAERCSREKATEHVSSELLPTRGGRSARPARAELGSSIADGRTDSTKQRTMASSMGTPQVLWNCSSAPLIAVCHYGLFRDLARTLPSLQENVYAPLRAQLGGVDIFVHALLLPSIRNARSGEKGDSLDPRAFFGISPACRYAAEDQDEVDLRLAGKRKKVGHHHKPAFSVSASAVAYDLSTTRNALRAMYSLQKTADMARAHELIGQFQYRFVAAVRPDTAVFTPVHLPDILLKASHAIMVPNTHHWGGVNDRFALGTRRAMLDVYMQWSQTMLSTGLALVSGEQQGKKKSPKEINTEGQLCNLLRNGGVSVVPSPLCVVRVRADGSCTARDLNPAVENLTCMNSVLVRFKVDEPGPCSSIAAEPRPWARHCYPQSGEPGSARLGDSMEPGAYSIPPQIFPVEATTPPLIQLPSPLKCNDVVKPIDPSPVRSPQAVHTALLEFFANRDVVEIGTRNGDGMTCFSRVTRSAVAIEIDPAYCHRLRARRAQQDAGNFTVLCKDYREARFKDVDIFTWWQQLPHLSNWDGLAHLARLRAHHKLRPQVEAVLLFDHSWRGDMQDWERLKKFASRAKDVDFDESKLCETLLGVADPDRRHCPSRAHGRFTIGVFPIAKLARATLRNPNATLLELAVRSA